MEIFEQPGRDVSDAVELPNLTIPPLVVILGVDVSLRTVLGGDVRLLEAASRVLRTKGKESSQVVNVAGPAIPVRLRDSLTGRVQVSVESDRLIVAIIPGLKQFIRSLP